MTRYFETEIEKRIIEGMKLTLRFVRDVDSEPSDWFVIDIKKNGKTIAGRELENESHAVNTFRKLSRDKVYRADFLKKYIYGGVI